MLIRWGRFVQTSPHSLQKASHAAAVSVLLSPALLVIDHIHFQYNGFMYGILVLSLVYSRKQSTMLFGGVMFAILLCFKHIYLYLAPAYFVYLLRAYCLSKVSILRIRWLNCVQLGASIVAVFAAAFGPFAYWNQMDQLLSRLFPFSRGLCHAYWAPNVWAMYSFTDRILLLGKPNSIYWIAEVLLNIAAAPRLGFTVDQSALNSVTRGLVGDSSFAVLPNVSPKTTFALTLGFQFVSLTTVLIRIEV